MKLVILLFSSLFDQTATLELAAAYGVHVIILIVLIFGIYYTTYRRKNFVFTFFLIGSIVFFLSFVMSKLNLNIGFALGLFAIFGIIRYRTDLIPIREMTYLFVIIGLSVVNGLTKNTLSLSEAVLLNLLTLVTVFVFEKLLNLRTESFKIVIYEKLDLLEAGKEEALKLDVKQRTNIPVERIEVVKFNFTKNNALLRVYYHSKKSENGGVSEMLGSDDADDD
jgi:hypothetical protein